jgi:phage terminase large subunit GpA-like protein
VEGGGTTQVSAIGIDSGGHYTSEVYTYARSRRNDGVFALKGQSVRNKPPIGKPSKVDISYKGKVLKNSAEVYPVGTDTIKATLFGRLKHNEPGAGYIHFHAEAGHDYFKQLTAERQVVRYVKGFAIREWKKKAGDRNEALDCFVYSFAALNFLYMRYNRATIFEQFSRRLGSVPVNARKAEPAPVESVYRPQRQRKARPTSSFVTNW